MATVLQMTQRVCRRLGLSSPNAVVSNPDPLIQQILSLMLDVGDDLVTETDWTALTVEYRFETEQYQKTGFISENEFVIQGLDNTAGIDSTFAVSGNALLVDTNVVSTTSTTATVNIPASANSGVSTFNFAKVKYELPQDFVSIVDYTEYNKSNRWALLGPDTQRQFQFLKSSFVSTGPRQHFVIQNNKLNIFPMPTQKTVLGYVYQSKYWIESSAGVRQEEFLVDTDKSVLSDQLITLGTILKFNEAKGFDTTASYRNYMNALSRYKALDGGNSNVNLSPQQTSVLMGVQNIPDTGFGGVT